MNKSVGLLYLEDIIFQIINQKNIAEKALLQVKDDLFFKSIDNNISNSIGIILKHIAGSIRSRWTDFLTTDGEKPDRNRDAEFELLSSDTRQTIMNSWDESFKILLDSINLLTEEDLSQTVYIRSEPHTVLKAINRQLTHLTYHVGQIVYLARFYAGEEWISISIPKGQSESFNEKMKNRK